jgi:hypothetical protein
MTIPDSVRARAREIETENGLGFDRGNVSTLAKSLAVCEHLVRFQVEGEVDYNPSQVLSLAAWAVSKEGP